ncbi:MAG: helix-turn-helix domain-containing protein, partial [Candidatus Limnocylindrales bacterium]
MTARHQIRVGGRRLGRDRGGPIDAQPAPPLGELLRIARETKGVDIFRAERDTKIRAKHLESLENGDYGSLPGAVYIKGFLRNYASYLGLDPDDVIERWREETSTTRRTEAVTVSPPRALVEPRTGLTFSRNVLVGAVLIVIVVLFLAYVGSQIIRFNQSATLTVDGPLVVTLAGDAQTHVIAGKTSVGATITVTGPLDFLATTTAAADGRWSLEVPVSKGRTDFTITARDASTGRDSDPVMMILTVPVPATPTPLPSASPRAPGATATAPPGLPFTNVVLTEPLDGAVVADGAVTVSGTTDATRITISALYLRPPAAPTPGPTGSPDPLTTPTTAPITPVPLPTASTTPAAAPAPVDVAIVVGAFTQVVDLEPGSWEIT